MNVAHLSECTVTKGVVDDCCFVTVDEATGHVMAVPTFFKGFTANKLTKLKLIKVFFN